MIALGFVALLLMSDGPRAGEGASDLPPAAALHNERGVALIAAGEPMLGIAELERSYAAMPDPLRHRAGRGKVLGSLRSALNERHATTGDPSHLRRLQGHLLRHLEALLTALGPDATPEDAAGTLRALGEVEAALASHPREPATAVLAAPPAAVADGRAVVADARPSAEDRGWRRRRAVGAGLLGVGLGSWIGTIVAAAIYADRYESVAGLRAEIDAAGRSPSVAEVMATRGWQHEAQAARVAASVTGGVGAVLVLTGLGLIVSDRRAARRVSVTPRVGAGGYGLGLHGTF